MLSSRLLRFVNSGEGSTLLEEATQAVEGVGGKVMWVEGGSLEVDKSCVYVMHDFESQQYKSLVGKCRIIGPLVVLGHVRNSWPLPASLQPVFCMAMYGVVACFTQAGSKEKREKLSQQIKLMGGRVEGNFTKRVTHLIAGQVGSDKYHVARKLRLPVLLPSWVEFCWEEALAQHSVRATDKDVLSQHPCLPFTGCTITVTGLEEMARLKVKEACQSNGGNYSGELTKGVCTHLLVGSKTSTKYKYACEWQLHCVQPRWLHDSVGAGYCMLEQEYSIEGGVATRKKPANQKAEPEWALALEALQIPNDGGSALLSGCKVYLCGFAGPQLEKLVQVVERMGGARSEELNGMLTHVVMGEGQVKVQEQARQLNSSVHVVRPQWLVESCAQVCRLAEGKYPYEDKTSATKRTLSDPPNGANPAPKRPRVLADDDLEAEDDIMNQYATGGAVGRAKPPSAPGVLGVCAGFSISRMFSLEDAEVASRVVCENGGTVVQPPGRADYLLAPLEGVWSKPEGVESDLDEFNGAVVTMIWLQRCIDEKHLLDHTSYFLFQPVDTPISSTTLVDCVLAFSQFSDMEREHLIRFSKGLGAVVQDHFARYPAHGLLATTHLLLKHATGNKYSSAIKWGIPAVADSWLFESAVSQKIAPVDPHLLREEEEEEGKWEEEGEGEGEGKGGAEDDMEEGESDYEEMDSILKGVVICFNRKLPSLTLSSAHDTAVILGATCCTKLEKSVTHYVCQGKATDTAKVPEIRLAKEQGCHVVSPHWLTQCEDKATRLPEEDYPLSFNPSMAMQVGSKATPTAHTMLNQLPKIPASTASSTALQDDTTSTSDPLEAMRDLHQQLEELREAPQEQLKRRQSRRLRRNEDKGRGTAPPISPHMPGKRRTHRSRRVRGKEEPLMDSQVSDSQLLQVTYDDPEGRRERAKLLARIEREEEQGIHRSEDQRLGEGEGGEAELRLELPSVSQEKPAARKRGLALSRHDASMRKKPEMQQATPTDVGRKPDAQQVTPHDVREEPGARDVHAGTPDTPPVVVPIVTSSKPPNAHDEHSRSARAQKPKFLLSSLEQREKIDYGALIQELGGEYIDQDYFTTRSTHLVVGRASRTEKFLGACAAGKWVLHKSYLEACRSAQHFVWEEGHEWGEKGEGTALEAAPRRWRMDLARRRESGRGRREDVGGAFVGWKVLVFAEKSKLPGLKRLLEAGGAIVVCKPSQATMKGVTHAFITITHFPQDQISLQDLVSGGVQCLRPEYIAEYLSKGRETSTEPFILNEVKPLLMPTS